MVYVWCMRTTVAPDRAGINYQALWSSSAPSCGGSSAGAEYVATRATSDGRPSRAAGSACHVDDA